MCLSWIPKTGMGNSSSFGGFLLAKGPIAKSPGFRRHGPEYTRPPSVTGRLSAFEL